ncbi:MAG: histidine--tRNA ligase [Patescibacteria group bacterium]|nr:histidine--tRNA ligase [Patescibacteria group bacterium]
MAKKQNKIKKPLKSPRGMHDIMGDKYYSYQGFFEKAQEIAMYYGFTPIATPIVEQEQIFNTSIGEGTDIIDKEMYGLKRKGSNKLAMRPEGTAGVMRSYIEHGMQSLTQPVMLYYYGPFFRYDRPQRGRYRQFHQFGVEVIGTDKSITDALVIKTTLSILEEAGAKNLVVDINSIGDKECRPAYVKELTSYYRKHKNELGKIDLGRLKTNPLRILDSKDPKTILVNENAPDSMSFLTGNAKKHFKQVLEYLEEMDVPYQINKNLVRGLSYYTHTVFEIVEIPEDELMKPLTLAGGGRYDYLAKMLGSKKDIPAIGMSIGVDRVVESSWFAKLNPKIIKKPKIYFIQLGFEAKLKSLNVIEILRKGKIPIVQSLSKNSLSAQLAIAEKMNMKYTIIFGQKEALENSVIVKDMANHYQKTIKMDDLLKYIKKLK